MVNSTFWDCIRCLTVRAHILSKGHGMGQPVSSELPLEQTIRRWAEGTAVLYFPPLFSWQSVPDRQAWVLTELRGCHTKTEFHI